MTDHFHRSAGSWDALAKWLDGQILEASAWQKASFEARKDLQGERWHARQCALYEVKMKLESSSAVEQDAVNVRGAGSIPASPATTFNDAQPARKYDMRALAKFLYEHCALDPDKAGDVAATLLEEYIIWPDDFAAQPPAAPVEPGKCLRLEHGIACDELTAAISERDAARYQLAHCSAASEHHAPEVFLFYRDKQLHHIHTDRGVFEGWMEKSAWNYPADRCEIVRYVPESSSALALAGQTLMKLDRRILDQDAEILRLRDQPQGAGK